MANTDGKRVDRPAVDPLEKRRTEVRAVMWGDGQILDPGGMMQCVGF